MHFPSKWITVTCRMVHDRLFPRYCEPNFTRVTPLKQEVGFTWKVTSRCFVSQFQKDVLIFEENIWIKDLFKNLDSIIEPNLRAAACLQWHWKTITRYKFRYHFGLNLKHNFRGNAVGWGYKSECLVFDSRCHWTFWPKPSSRTMSVGSSQLQTEMNTRNLAGDKGRPARKANNPTATCEPNVYKMWEPRRLTTLWASTVCYRDIFTLYLYCWQPTLMCVNLIFDAAATENKGNERTKTRPESPCCTVNNWGARGSVVGWDTMLQAGRLRVQVPMRSLDSVQLT
jgi:hypothetical protein